MARVRKKCSIAVKLAERMKLLGLSPPEAAGWVGCSDSTIKRWLTLREGDGAEVKLSQYRKLAELLGLTCDELADMAEADGL